MRQLGCALVLVFALAACSGGSHNSARPTPTSRVPRTGTAPKTVGGQAETFVVTGTLRVVGGPAPGVDKGIPGNIRALTNTGRVIATVPTSANGKFSLNLPKGVYVLKGSAGVTGGRYNCGGGPIRLARSALSNLLVVCNID